ncbi:hypothetical protein MKX01_003980 [Papaver californicum]|nr:hypothetical protein MKX01_003980 [Papaver californicum]
MHFYEIFHTSIIRDKRLELSKEFTVKYGKELSDHAIIKVPNGIWHIGLRNAEGVILFENGWPEFMEFYSICVGHVILFRYDGNSKFQLHIFGMDATEIDYPSHIDNANHDVEMTSTHSDEDKVEVVSIHSGSTQSNDEPSMSSESSLNQKAKLARQGVPKKSRKQKTVIPKRFHTKEFKATLEAAEAFKSENPFFKIILQASHIKRDVRVPVAFANSCLRNITRMVITLKISDGRTWEVGYVSRTQTEKAENMLSKGWCKFVADNHLMEGDACVFELVDKKKIEMNVHIFRQQKTFARKLTPKIRHYTEKFQAKLEASEEFTYEKIMHYTAKFQATLEAAEEFKSENPFFKIVMQASYIERQLVRVPVVFATSHFTNITQMMITLRVSDGRTWEVGYVSRAPNERRLSQGWRKFVVDNELKEGDVCVFELVDRKKFKMNVHIFRQQKTFDYNVARHEFPQKSRKQKMFIPIRLYTKAFQETLEAAEAFKSGNPFFKVIVQASYIKGTVRVPIVFAKSYLRNITQRGITLRISNGRTWEVVYVSRTPTERRLSLGWYKFSADNHLKEGDVCVFELVDRKKFKMNVHIFRQQKTFARKRTPIVRNYTAEFQATLEAAKEFTSENPFFKVAMQASYIKRHLVRYLRFLATSHFTNITQMMLTLRVSDGRTWEVGYASLIPTEKVLSQGWHKFVADNDLKEGDVCVFELVDRKNIEMIVTSSDNQNHLPGSLLLNQLLILRNSRQRLKQPKSIHLTIFSSRLLCKPHIQKGEQW